MSFYINNNNPNRPGPINSSALSNISERVLIEANKVFDACINRDTVTGAIITLTNFTPAGPTEPLTYVSAQSDPLNPATISNVTIDRIDSRPNYANVSATITIPITVSYLDANRIPGTATGTITVDRSAVLFVPQVALTPVEVKVVAAVSSEIGTISGTTATITYCIQTILKIVSEVDILVPSFGYPVLPPCQIPNPAQTECPGFFELPVYPTAQRNG